MLCLIWIGLTQLFHKSPCNSPDKSLWIPIKSGGEKIRGDLLLCLSPLIRGVGDLEG